MPTRPLRSGVQRSVEVSPSRMLPVRGAVKPVMTSSIVVLPAPFGPISPSTSPGASVKLTVSRAMTPPKATEMSRTSSETGGRSRRGSAARTFPSPVA